MDDYLDSFTNRINAIKTIHDVINILNTGSFRLHKWISNDREILLSLPNSKISSKVVDLQLNDLPIEQALGLLLDPQKDVLQIKAVDKDLPVSKRGILSFISSIFDPLGMIAPAILEPKLIIQKLWRLNVDWYDELPSELKQRWEEWKKTLQDLPSMEIPRWYDIDFTNEQGPQLHVFADASNNAYGAVAYLRQEHDENVKCSFIFGKSRLAPIKQNSLTIPKLELQAATIASRIKLTILQEMREVISKIYLWTDSKTVLNYLNNENANFGVYVTHRVNEIRNNTNIEDWHYVQSKSNVADDATRCRSFSDLNSNCRWFNRPEFIHENVITEPESCDIYRTDKTNLNINAITKTNSDIILSTEAIPLINWCYYSSLSKLVRHLAWILKLKGSWISGKELQKREKIFHN